MSVRSLEHAPRTARTPKEAMNVSVQTASGLWVINKGNSVQLMVCSLIARLIATCKEQVQYSNLINVILSFVRRG